MGLYGTRSFDASRSAGQIRGAGDGGRSGPGPNQLRLRGRVQGLAVEPGLADARVIRALRTQIERVVLGRIAQGRLGVVDHRRAGGGGQVPDTDVRMLWVPGGLARELALHASRFVGDLRADMVDLDRLAGPDDDRLGLRVDMAVLAERLHVPGEVPDDLDAAGARLELAAGVWALRPGLDGGVPAVDDFTPDARRTVGGWA